MFNQSGHRFNTLAQKCKKKHTTLFVCPHETHFRGNPTLLLQHRILVLWELLRLYVWSLAVVLINTLCVCIFVIWVETRLH